MSTDKYGKLANLLAARDQQEAVNPSLNASVFLNQALGAEERVPAGVHAEAGKLPLD